MPENNICMPLKVSTLFIEFNIKSKISVSTTNRSIRTLGSSWDNMSATSYKIASIFIYIDDDIILLGASR